MCEKRWALCTVTQDQKPWLGAVALPAGTATPWLLIMKTPTWQPASGKLSVQSQTCFVKSKKRIYSVQCLLSVFS